MKFVPARLNPSMNEVAERALKLSLYFLGLDDHKPELNYFLPLENDQEDAEIRFRMRPMEGPENLTGCCLEFGPEVWIKADLPEDELIICIGHEMYHYGEHVKGIDDPNKEANAEAFGEFILNQMAIYKPLPILHAVRHVDENEKELQGVT